MQNLNRDEVTNGSYQTPQGGRQQEPPKQGGMRAGAMALLALVLAAVFGTGLFAGWQYGRSGGTGATMQPGTGPTAGIPPLTSNNIEQVRTSVIAKVRPSVVQINVETQQGGGLGSGVILDQRGNIVTNYHVIEGQQRIEVMFSNGQTLPGEVVGTAPTDDLAVIRVDPGKARLTAIPMGDSSDLQVGQEVLAVGNPLGITQTVTNGIVSALGRNVSEGANGATLPDTIQTDAPINPGNSGGALVDLQGRLVGIPTLTAIDPEFKTPANGVGFAIPANRVRFIAPQLIDSGKVTNTGRAALGVQVTTVDPALAAQNNLPVDHGVLIVDVTANGPAAKAGLRQGDIIVQINDKAVNDVSSLSDALVSLNPGDQAAVKVYRGNQQITVNVTLGELPSR